MPAPVVAVGEARLMGGVTGLLNRGFPGSTWGNLGLWTATQDYPAACEALAVRLAERARLEPGSSVLDVGFGCGDQLLLWKQRFGVGRITGVEVDEAGITEARRKLSAYDDVSFLPDGRMAYERHDRVLALDCAYHFAPRSAFFARALQALNAGGVLALTDLVTGNDGPGRFGARLARACDIPPENLLTQEAYAQSLADLGYANIRFGQLDEEVLSGFSRFAFRHLRRHWTRAFTPGGLKVLATAVIAVWLRRRNAIHYVLVTAERSSAAPAMRAAAASPEAAALSSKGKPGEA